MPEMETELNCYLPSASAANKAAQWKQMLAQRSLYSNNGIHNTYTVYNSQASFRLTDHGSSKKVSPKKYQYTRARARTHARTSSSLRNPPENY